MKKCKEIGKTPVSMGVDTWGVDFVLLDKDDKVIGNTVGYRDHRTDGMDEEVYKIISLEDLYARVRNFHVAVKEAGKQIIFLRKLEPGGTAHSFGIHVARMAGMPKEVLSMAEKTLSALEAKDEAEASARSPKGDGAVQLSLFQLDDPALASLRDQLRKADLDNMTPLQAFDLLRDMKKELGL